jgi:RHS repeat-associated protein
MTSATLPSSTGIVSAYTYDDADRLTGISHVKDGSTTVASVAYTLDDVGNRTQRVDQQGTHTYAYDDLYRLTSVTYPGPSTTTYAFDAFGNRTSMTTSAGTTAYTYDDADRITGVQPPSPAAAIDYTWDDNGNLMERGSDTFEWDYEDRMVEATVNSVSTTFAYRGDGLRDSRTVGMTTTTFTWDINSGLPVVLDDGSQYLYGAGLSAMKQSGDWFYYLADGLGSTMAIVDADGDVENGYTYDVYGEPTVTGSLTNEFDFAGQQTDGSTGLQYLRARYYDPATGTFLSRDPMANETWWLSSGFGYGRCDPVAVADPTGMIPADGSDPKSLSARQKLCLSIAERLLEKAQKMRTDREVIEGRGTGRPATDAEKKNKQGRWRDSQGVVKELMGRWRRLECAKHIGTGALPHDIEELEHGEYPKFQKASRFPWSNWEWPEAPDVWWDGNPVNPWDFLIPPIGPHPLPNDGY